MAAGHTGAGPGVARRRGSARAPTATIDPANVVGARILVAEDNDINFQVVEAYLERAGYAVQRARNGIEAVASAFDVDLILMDLEMPDMDGVAATRAIRRAEVAHGAPATPVLALTAHALQEYRDQALAAGCDGYIAKPVRMQALLDVVSAPGLNRYPALVGSPGTGDRRTVSRMVPTVARMAPSLSAYACSPCATTSMPIDSSTAVTRNGITRAGPVTITNVPTPADTGPAIAATASHPGRGGVACSFWAGGHTRGSSVTFPRRSAPNGARPAADRADLPAGDDCPLRDGSVMSRVGRAEWRVQVRRRSAQGTAASPSPWWHASV